MLALEKWAKDKSTFIALSACMTACSAREIYEALQHIKERRLFGYYFSLPRKISDWSNLYRNEAKSRNAFFRFLAESSEFGEQVVEFNVAAQVVHNAAKHSPEGVLKLELSHEVVSDALQFNMNFRSSCFAHIKDNNSRSDIPEQMKLSCILAENEMEIAFYFLVYFPCWFLYQMSPTRLYRLARQGDEKALAKLLHLDPLMLSDPAIAKQLQKLRLSNKRAVFVRLLEATYKPLKISLKKVKTSSAALLSFLSRGIDQELNEAQLRKLSDAAKQDQTGDKFAIDQDIPSNESLTRSLHRKRPDWEKLLQPDKKI